MSFDPATVRAVVAHLRRLADNAAGDPLRDAQRAMGYRTSANAILRQFGPEAPAPEPSTDWTCPACGVLGDRQSCRNCGAECRPAEPSTDTLRELLRQAREALRLTREYVGEDTLPAIPGWSWFDAMQAIDEELVATPAREDDERCEHDWIDIRNEVIESGEMCSHCGALRAAPWQEGR
jgi:hypothetical protein